MASAAVSTDERALPARAAAFDPGRVGPREAAGWRAYYARRWLAMAWQLYRLARDQFGLSAWAALRFVRHGAEAARVFKPVDHDLERVRAALTRSYAVLARATGLGFDPAAAAEAELDYWVIHRRIVGEVDRAPLIEALARIPAAVYGLPVARLRPSAVERERAVRLVDQITGGQQPSTDAAWAEITAALTRSYELLKAALTGPTA